MNEHQREIAEASLLTGRMMVEAKGEALPMLGVYQGGRRRAALVSGSWPTEMPEIEARAWVMLSMASLLQADTCVWLNDAYVRRVPVDSTEEIGRLSEDPKATDSLIVLIVVRNAAVYDATQDYHRADDGSVIWDEIEFDTEPPRYAPLAALSQIAMMQGWPGHDRTDPRLLAAWLTEIEHVAVALFDDE